MIIGPGGIPKTGFEPASTELDRINLKNGRAQQPYQTSIEGYSDIRLLDHGGTGLTITAVGELTGSDIAAGEYTVLLSAQKAGRLVDIRARLSIIANPRDLWKNIASDQEDPWAKTDEASACCRSQEACIVAASKRGRSHAQEGRFREDDFAICADTETGWHLLVVADGAGSAAMSREGSRIACEVVSEVLPALLAKHLDPQLEAIVAAYTRDPESQLAGICQDLLYPVLPEAALKAAQAIEVEAESAGYPPQEYATTLVIAVSRQVSGQWLTASFTVGDGGVAIFDARKNKVAVLCRPDSGEFAGQTRFLSRSIFTDTPDIQGRLFMDIRESFTVLAVMTDGVTDPKFPTDAALGNCRIWSAFWYDDIGQEVSLESDNPMLETQMLNWLDFWSRGNHDDRTLALMLPESQSKERPVERVNNSATVDAENQVPEDSAQEDPKRQGDSR